MQKNKRFNTQDLRKAPRPLVFDGKKLVLIDILESQVKWQVSQSFDLVKAEARVSV